MRWSAEVLFRVLEQHEPQHPLLEEAYRQAMHTFLDAEAAYQWMAEAQDFEWKLRELPVVSPFSFPIYASKIKESMMLEDPAAAIERIYFEMYAGWNKGRRRECGTMICSGVHSLEGEVRAPKLCSCRLASRRSLGLEELLHSKSENSEYEHD